MSKKVVYIRGRPLNSSLSRYNSYISSMKNDEGNAWILVLA